MNKHIKKCACDFFVVFFHGSTVECTEESVGGRWVKKTKQAQKIYVLAPRWSISSSSTLEW